MEPIDFSDLYRKYATDVFRFALYLSGNRSDAEDITSETFVRAFASSETLRMTTVKAYLFTIARNLFLMSLRNRSQRTALNENFRDATPSPYDQVEQKANLAAVWEHVKTLAEIDRAALLMRTFDELPYEEIAQILNISITSAKVKVHRARAALLTKSKIHD